MEVKLHDIGEGMSEADISCFLVKPGDFVQADEPLVEVQTDKMSAEIPAPKAGVVREFQVEPGQTVAVGTTLLILEESTMSIEKTSHEKQRVKDKVRDAVEKKSYTGEREHRPKRILASPFTRKIARENEINIEMVTGSGPLGRIIDEDIYRFLESKRNQPALDDVIKIIPVLSPSENTSHVNDTIPFRGKRKQIAKKMAQSLYTIPHCTHFEEIDVTELIRFRSELKTRDQNISATAFFLKALSICIKEFPVFNARLDEENEIIRLLHEHHIGNAVDTNDGLIVPVIRNVEQKSIRTINTEMKKLTEKALENKLSINDISGGTFTISNVGPLGGSFGATPIIQHPQTALVSFHKTKKMPVVRVDDQIVIRSIMNISMSFDHRVADGGTAVRFTNRFAQLIQDPKMILLELV